MDRYTYSGVAFSGAKGLDLEWCLNCDKGLPAPDAVIYLNISVENAEKRGGYGNERYEKREMQLQVSKLFSQMQNEKWMVLDATKSMDQLEEEIETLAMNVIAKASSQSIATI
jgi:dTMP kinase